MPSLHPYIIGARVFCQSAALLIGMLITPFLGIFYGTENFALVHPIRT